MADQFDANMDPDSVVD